MDYLEDVISPDDSARARAGTVDESDPMIRTADNWHGYQVQFSYCAGLSSHIMITEEDAHHRSMVQIPASEVWRLVRAIATAIDAVRTLEANEAVGREVARMSPSDLAL